MNSFTLNGKAFHFDFERLKVSIAIARRALQFKQDSQFRPNRIYDFVEEVAI